MRENIIRAFSVTALILCAIAAGFGQNRFEGYSFTLEANESGACPFRFLPNTEAGNSIDVFVAGTGLRTPATGLRSCEDSPVRGSRVTPNGLQRWCFEGPEPMYEIKMSNGASYIWPAVGRDTGFYNLNDFRPVTRTAGPTPKYEYTTPADYTSTFKNAVFYIAARKGGTLMVPDGDYILGTLDGNRRDPRFEGITLPSGITIQGASANYSVPTTNLPEGRSSTRIRLRNENQAIFRIGGCTNQVAIRNLELLGNTGLYGEARRNSTGNFGVEALGKWDVNPANRAESPNSSQFFTFENVTFQNLDRGINVHNVNADRCSERDQKCNAWQFDYIKVDHGVFLNNKIGIYVDTFNTDWKVTNSMFFYAAANAPGTGIHVKRAGTMLVEQSFGGGYNYAEGIGGTFIFVETLGSMTIINSAAEAGQRSLYTSPQGSISSVMINAIGNTFGDKVELNGRVNFISNGNFYAAKTFQSDPNVTITSIGDKFCYDPQISPGYCKDSAGNAVRSPGFDKGRVMFRTGRLPEGSGANLIERQPNYFGYDVEIGNGIMQYDPDIGFKDIMEFAGRSEGGQRVRDGAMVYCRDCRVGGGGICQQGSPGRDGAFAKRINGEWRCD